MHEPPNDDAFGRVTDPDRFHVLHEVASALLEELTAQYVSRKLIGHRSAVIPVIEGDMTGHRLWEERTQELAVRLRRDAEY